MFVTGSEWPMSAWDFTSTVTESGVTWGFDCCPQARIYIFNKLPLGLPLTWLGEHQYLPECFGDTDAIVNEERIEREVNGDTTT